MAPSRSRKRDSTLKTVELLNSVGNVNNDRTLRSRILNQPRRTLSGEAPVPRSDDIWRIPTSPGKSRENATGHGPDSDPTTPRRSARVRGHHMDGNVSAEDWLPTDGNNHEEEDDGEDDGDGGDNQENEDGNKADNQGQENNEDKDEGEDGGNGNTLYMFSDDESVARRSSQNSRRYQWEDQGSPKLPSPRALFNGQGSDAFEAEQEHTTTSYAEEGRSAGLDDENTRISITRSREESTHSYPGVQVEVQLPDRSPQESDQESDSSSLFVRQETHDHTEPESEHDPGVRLADYEQSDEAISVFEPEDFQDESSSSSESATSSESEAEEFMQPQFSKRRRVVQDAPSRIRRRRSRMRPWESPVLRDEPGNSGSPASQSDDNGEHEAENDAAYVAIEEEKARGLRWMQDAMNLGQQRENWLVLTGTAKELKRLADPSMADYCADICAAIRGLRDLYGKMVDSPAPSAATLTQCDNFFSSISCEAEKLLDRAYYQATDPHGDDRAHDLVAEFEARAVPDMVKLVIACFHVYYADAMLFQGVSDHFRRALILLRRLWDRTNSMKVQRIVRGVMHGKAFGRALTGLVHALETRALRRRPRTLEPLPSRGGAPPDHPPRQETGMGFPDERGTEWSRDEGLALIDGLQLYQGSDRYLRIIGRFGHRLRHRTQRELRAKALQVHDRMRPTIETQLQADERARRQWGWLLSVRDDADDS